MCGIAGAFFPRGTPPAIADVAAMMGVLAHRGPDGDGRYASPDQRYQAGFRRLAIIDLATGQQPVFERGGRRALIGNGEIYNYLELRREHPEYPYRSDGDMEVVLPLAARHGDSFVDRLNGMFALALYDRHAHRLVLARDRLGVKPLYWAALAGGGLVFASEAKAIFASGLVEPAVDEDAVSQYLAHGFVPAPKTLFRGVGKLPPGHLLAVEADGRLSLRRYWRPEAASDLPDGEDAVAERLVELLTDSVRLQLRSDVPVGLLLSGGIDSGLLAALAARAAGQPLDAYTVAFEGAPEDETPLAREVARRIGARHTALQVAAADVVRHLPRLVWFAEEPLNDAALLPNALVEEVLSRHVKVVLNGTGGDELFAGYGRYFRLPIETAYGVLPAWLRRRVIEPAAARFSPMTAWRLARAELFEGDRGRYLHEHGCHFPPPLRRLLGNALAAPEAAQARAFAEFEGPPQSAALYADIGTYLPDDLLTLLDRTSMAASVEARVPFLDHRLVEAALAVPPAMRTPGGRQKGLLRRIAARYLPPAVAGAPKRGFVSPVPAWMRAGLDALARRLLASKAALERGWWAKEGVERLVADPDRHGFRVYTLLMLELAVRIHVEGPRRLKPPVETLEDFADAA
jgi:asparagine synthase (glutamine-hydrolysing)